MDSAFSWDIVSLYPVQRISGISGRISLSFCARIRPGHLRHGVVGDHEIKGVRVFGEYLQCIRAICCANDVISQTAEHPFRHLDEDLFVIHKEDPFLTLGDRTTRGLIRSFRWRCSAAGKP